MTRIVIADDVPGPCRHCDHVIRYDWDRRLWLDVTDNEWCSTDRHHEPIPPREDIELALHEAEAFE